MTNELLGKNILIGTHTIGKNNPPFIIAEMSGNHNQSLERALNLVDAAAAAGVDALKIQTYTADSVTNENVRAIRPGFGLAPKHLTEVLTRKFKCAVKRGTPLNWNLL